MPTYYVYIYTHTYYTHVCLHEVHIYYAGLLYVYACVHSIYTRRVNDVPRYCLYDRYLNIRLHSRQVEIYLHNRCVVPTQTRAAE